MSNSLTELRKALQTSQDRALATNTYGLALAEINKPKLALKYFRQAVKLQPQQAQYHNHCAQASLSLNQTEAAIDYFRTSLKLAPEQAEVYYNLALIYAERLNAPNEALRMFKDAIEKSPKHLMSYISLSCLLVAQQSAEDARKQIFELLGTTANSLQVHKGMARALMKYGRYEEARQEHLLAMDMSALEADTFYGLGETELGLRNVEDATHCYRRAYEIAPNHPWALAFYLQHLIQLGDCKAAQTEYRSYLTERQAKPLSAPSRTQGIPEWEGSSLKNKTILVVNILGDGDAIHFSRFAWFLKQAGATVVVQCAKSLKSALHTIPGVDLVISKFEDRPAIDYYCRPAFSSLLFDWTWETIGDRVPYMHVPSQIKRKWCTQFNQDNNLRVGLNWQGSPKSHYNPHTSRSIPLEQLKPLSEIPGVTLYSLQFGQDMEALRQAGINFNIHDLQVGDYRDTAGAVDCLDLIISADTSLAHLAGALGKPTYLMLPFVSCWRWMLNRQDTPWYPSMTLFRQSQPGDWATVISQICQSTRIFSHQKMIERQSLPL